MRFARIVRITAASLVFLAALVTYWSCVSSGVSYWDCPEYVLTAVALDIGHPPGNPFWTLVHRFAVNFAPTGCETLVVNLMAGIFSAAAAALLYGTAFFAIRALLSDRKDLPFRRQVLVSAAGSVIGSLCFAWCDSVWFSAIEAEVYAFSIFLTALSLRVMMGWMIVRRKNPVFARRLLMLEAYLAGLSLCVHQLNLLVLPVLALMWVYGRHNRLTLRNALPAAIFSILMIPAFLLGIMPGTASFAAGAELIAVNRLGLPFDTGVWIYLAALFLSMILATVTVALYRKNDKNPLLKAMTPVFILIFLFLSGVFTFIHPASDAAFLTALATIALMSKRMMRSALTTDALWGLALVMIGFSAYFFIPLRSAAHPPVNEGTPSDPFAYKAYIDRDQYGKTPLVNGPTPFSRPMFKEELAPDGSPVYNRYALDDEGPVYVRSCDGKESYIVSRNKFRHILTPELNMPLSRLHGRGETDLQCYDSWLDMRPENMRKITVSHAFDSAGHPVGRLLTDGTREKEESYKPTVAQNLKMFGIYQFSYMYLRYLLWNFSGRQNDIAAGGEVDHGNFITGIPVLDNAMLGEQALLPPEAGTQNKGHNRYYMLPLLLGLAGFIALFFNGKCGRRINAANSLLFIMTGLAIVVYLNQGFGQARERDYTFLGSYYAFSFWIACACALLINAIWHKLRRTAALIATVLLLGVPALMAFENYDDHDRSGQFAPDDYACNILRSMPEDAVLFVDGDNFTFPLWYAQEVLGVRTDVAVVNTSYLALRDYCLSLRIPGRSGRSVPLSNPDSIIREGLTTITTGHDSLTVNIHPPGSQRSLRRAVILDIVRNNLSAPDSRPLCWLNGLRSNDYASLQPLMKRIPFAYVLSDSAVNVPNPLTYMLPGVRQGKPHPYGDEIVNRQTALQRLELLRHSRRLLKDNRVQPARDLAHASLGMFPYSRALPGRVADLDTMRWETDETVDILLDLAQATSSTGLLDTALMLIDSEIERSDKWLHYYESLPSHLRSVISPGSLRLAKRGNRLKALGDSVNNLKRLKSAKQL